MPRSPISARQRVGISSSARGRQSGARTSLVAGIKHLEVGLQRARLDDLLVAVLLVRRAEEDVLRGEGVRASASRRRHGRVKRGTHIADRVVLEPRKLRGVRDAVVQASRRVEVRAGRALAEVDDARDAGHLCDAGMQESASQTRTMRDKGKGARRRGARGRATSCPTQSARRRATAFPRGSARRRRRARTCARRRHLHLRRELEQRPSPRRCPSRGT